MRTIELTANEVEMVWRLGSEFYLYELVEVQGRQFTTTCASSAEHPIMVTLRSLVAPRWTLTVLGRYGDRDNLVGDFWGDQQAMQRDLFMLKMFYQPERCD